jgi:hypothetical protein
VCADLFEERDAGTSIGGKCCHSARRLAVPDHGTMVRRPLRRFYGNSPVEVLRVSGA